MSIFGFLKREKETLVPLSGLGLRCDMHSHLLPAVDDGSASTDDSLALIDGLLNAGYRKLILTPHVMAGFYNNTYKSVKSALAQLKTEVSSRQLNIELDAAAEYYIDYEFMQKLGKEPMLTFGDNMLLFECSFVNRHDNFNETVFEMQINGYTPVLAHPERYLYWHGKIDHMRDLHDRGILFQINILSIAKAYSKDVNNAAQALIDAGLVDFIGTDLHNASQLNIISQTLVPQSVFDKLSSTKLLNNSLL